MQEIPFDQFAPQVLQQLPKGAFLNVSHGGRDNTMTIGWGSLGVVWGKPVFSVLVRPSRYTFDLLEASGEFSVCCSLAFCANCSCNCWRDWLSKLAMYCVQKRLNSGLIVISFRKSCAGNW